MHFLLKNAARYETLVSRLTPETTTASVSSLAGGRREQTRTTDANTIPDPNMVVSARIRPFLDEDRAAGFPNAMFPRKTQEGSLDMHDLYNHPRGIPVLKSYNYHVDRLFDGDTATETIYDELVADLIPFARSGGIATLFAYGQTGSGKTYTISRLEHLALDALVGENEGSSRDNSNSAATPPPLGISVTIIELAGNSVFDLLSERKAVAVRDDASGVTQLVGAAEVQVTSRAQVQGLVEQAASFRRSAPTLKNAASSRSHAICRIRIKQQQQQKDGFLYLIDLAGSEAARDVAVHGADRMREAREINMSLSVLKDCIRGRAEADAAAARVKLQARNGNSAKGPSARKPVPRIPFRQAALTRILKHVFDPAAAGEENGVAAQGCRTAVIACVNPSLADVGASKNTLRYAELLRVMVPAPGAGGAERRAEQTKASNGPGGVGRSA
ncbi:P-loop containing nucleoside triphosphate hydrolase protein [Microdochium bolleyi]|uniref:p-loop containing nucleoside triphosphate hydrolase protein n=1 Tax=Microdochium bolleyi TaxID=196109 RepID=A0A136IM46_9PEZI|nr:P-loop containing nucleoside triphosphate hydrolase protein [Microdochium bolleyi]